MKYTSNYGFKKPDETDVVDIQDLNDNADAVDAKIKENVGKIIAIENEVINKLSQAAISLGYPSIVEHFTAKIAGGIDVNIDGSMAVNYAPRFDSSWVLQGGFGSVVVNSDRSVTLTADGVNVIVYYRDISFLPPDTQFTLKVGESFSVDVFKPITIDTGEAYYGNDIVFTTPSDVTGLQLRCMVPGSQPNGSTHDFEDIQIELGDTRGVDSPFCFSAQPLQNPTVRVINGDNLFNKDSIIQGSYYSSIGDVVSEATSERSDQVINVKPNTTYIANDWIRVSLYDLHKNHIERIDATQFTTPSNCSSVKIAQYQKGLGYLENIVLNEGTTIKPYTPYSEGLAIIPTYLAEIDTYQDKLLRIEGTKAIVDRGIRRIVLDNSFDWMLHSNNVGHKEVRVENIAMGIAIQTGIKLVKKYDGKILIPTNDLNHTPDGVWDEIGSNEQNLYISIPNTDSGWGETYTPTADEIKAYMMGYRMYDTSTGNVDAPYTRTDGNSKGWVEIITRLHGTGVLPIESYDEWTPYELFYALVEPVEEQIDIVIPADMKAPMVTEGSNTVVLESGLVWEKANPRVKTEVYYINRGLNADETVYESKLEYKPSKIKKIYKKKDGVTTDDTSNWTLTATNAYGDELVYQVGTLFDKEAEYYVLYEMLDEEYNSQVVSGSITYEENMRESHNKLVEEVKEVEGDIADVRQVFEDIGIKGDGERIEEGLVDVTSILSGDSVVAYITFEKSFVEIPKVFMNNNTGTKLGGKRVVREANDITRTGFTLRVGTCDMGSYLVTESKPFSWVAIEK